MHIHGQENVLFESPGRQGPGNNMATNLEYLLSHGSHLAQFYAGTPFEISRGIYAGGDGLTGHTLLFCGRR